MEGWRGDGSTVPGRRLLRAVLLAASLLTLGAPAAPLAHAAAAANATPPIEEHAAALNTGDILMVRADGDCLRLREVPGLDTRVLDCLAEGSSVTALAGTATVAGLAWREVASPRLRGWVAERYLTPAPPVAGCGGPAATLAGITGALPPGGGSSLFIWGGGTTEGIRDAAAVRGCTPRSVWATTPDGAWVSYIFGAPAFVNRAWGALFPGGRIPGPRALLLYCDAPVPSSGTGSAASNLPPPPASALRPVPVDASTAPTVSAQAAIVVDGASGAVLYEKDARRPLPQASLTKIATAIVTLEGADLDAWAASDVDARTMTDSSVMGLRVGDCFTVRDLLHGLMLPSGNDAALVLGRYVAGGDDAFLTRMRTMLDRLGLDNTRFVDPHGLGGDGHASSAYDIAMLARYAMHIPEFEALVTTRSWTALGTSVLALSNRNAFLELYEGADGVKTGFTEDAGLTLAASATREGRRLHVVVLNSPEHYADAARLLDWAFGAFDFP